ncbi:MAG: hypothetical protein ACKOC5_04170, partial [Chloroflexota bacterium]
PQDVQVTPLDGRYQASPLSHHMSAETLMALANSLYGAAAQAVLVSVRGDRFGFSHQLSPTAAKRVEPAVQSVCNFCSLC